jgi:hypothetical protein
MLSTAFPGTRRMSRDVTVVFLIQMAPLFGELERFSRPRC